MRAPKAFVLLSFAVALNAQQFDVTSVKPHAESDETPYVRAFPGGRFQAVGVTPLALIRVSYRIPSPLILGGPGWMSTERFDLQATGGRGSRLRDMQEEIRAMLADRFGLVAHFEAKEMPVLALVTSKLGADRLIVSAEETVNQMTITARSISGRHVTMAQVAQALSDSTQEVIVDGAGLDGFYDVELAWLPDGETPAEDSPPGLVELLREKYGIGVKRTRQSVSTLHVDRIEKPSSN